MLPDDFAIPITPLQYVDLGGVLGRYSEGVWLLKLADCSNTAMLQHMKTHLLTVQSRGTVALPADLRRRLHLDQADAQIKLIEREDGRIELVPVVAVPADQAWFWTDRWQAMEREADGDVAAGRVTVVEGPDELIEHLDS